MKKRRLTAVLLTAAMAVTACRSAAPETAGTAVEQPGHGGETTGGTEGTTAGTAGESAAGESGTGEIRDITGNITVACYDTMIYRTFLEEAAKLFEEKYPGTSVTVESFSEMPEIKTIEQDGQYIATIMDEDDPQGRADYISKTSTALMSGEGADLLAMDVLPLHKYVEAGQLVNLQEYMDRDPEFNRADYRQNILDAAAFRNGTWFLPLDYSFDYYTYDSTLVDSEKSPVFGTDKAFTASQLMAAGQPVFDGSSQFFSSPAYLPDGSGDLFTQMFREKYRHFVDLENKTANFDDGAFEKLLTDISEMEAEGYISPGRSEEVDMDALVNSLSEAPTKRFVFKSKNCFSLVMQTFADSGEGLMINMSDAESGIETDDEIAGICGEESGAVPFTYEQAFGMNANSTNKDTAWAFLKFLLSYEVQASPSMSFGALPLHNEARRDNADNLYRMMMADGNELNPMLKESLDNYINTIETMSDLLNAYTLTDTAIQDMVNQETGYYFAGTKTAGEVSRTLQSKVSLYLDE